MKQKFDVTGMSCAACSARVEKCVSRLEGVENVAVNLLANSMTVEFDENALSTEGICSAVEKAGYGAFPKSGAPGAGAEGSFGAAGAAGGAAAGGGSVSAAAQEVLQMKRRLIASIIFFVPLFYISMGHMAGLPQPGFLTGLENAVTYGMTQLVLTLILMYINRKYYESGFPAFVRRAPNMDSLIAVGSLAAVIYGIFAIIRIGHGLALQDWDLVERYHMDLYFESAGTILTLITVGKYLEARSKGKTTDAVSKLLALSPDTALAERDGAVVEIPVEDVRVGDILQVKPGSRIPVDGVIVEGASTVDESFLTGESIPVDKTVGDAVTGASINQSGFFRMKAECVGNDTALAKIVALVEDAGGSKAPIAKLADRIAGIFVPVVMLIALGAAAGWLLAGQTFEFALSTGIAVLVISCPCALGLATPAAIMAGTGRGAELGILYKNAEILENSRAVDTVVMDKTGTLTTGHPGVAGMSVSSSLMGEGDSREAGRRLLALAAAVERPSEHPLGKAIAEHAETLGLEVPQVSGFEAVHGKGVRGEVQGQKVVAGNLRMMEEAGIDIRAFSEAAQEYAQQGATPLFFAADGEAAGVIAVADMVRPESADAVRAFESMGIQVIMLTGDNRRTADAIAEKLGITQVRAEILPQDKEAVVRSIMEQGHQVAMVGDGINDAPALARADVGIAIGAGTDVAVESADVVLMKSSPMDAVAGIQLSRAVIRNVKMNLFWAFFYNIIGIPVAAGILYPFFQFKLNPMIGAAAMSLSSFCVVTNALRLRFFQPDKSVRREAAPVSDAGHPQQEAHFAGDGNVTAHGADAYTINIIHNEHAAEVPGEGSAAEKEKNRMEKKLNVEGMMCKNCVAHVEKALKAIEGVADATADLEAKTATVVLSADVADEVLVKAVADEGYPAEMA